MADELRFWPGRVWFKLLMTITGCTLLLQLRVLIPSRLVFAFEISVFSSFGIIFFGKNLIFQVGDFSFLLRGFFFASLLIIVNCKFVEHFQRFQIGSKNLIYQFRNWSNAIFAQIFLISTASNFSS